MLKHNTSVIDTLHLSHKLAELTYQLSLKLTKEVSPKYLKWLTWTLPFVACELKAAVNTVDWSVRYITKKLHPFIFLQMWNNLEQYWREIQHDTKFKPGIMKGYFLHSLAGNLIYKLTETGFTFWTHQTWNQGRSRNWSCFQELTGVLYLLSDCLKHKTTLSLLGGVASSHPRETHEDYSSLLWKDIHDKQILEIMPLPLRPISTISRILLHEPTSLWAFCPSTYSHCAEW